MMSKNPKSIKETQDGLINNEFSACEITREYFRNISEENKELNAFLTINYEKSLDKAEKIDKLISSRGSDLLKQYPLLGICVAHKDMFVTKDVRTTAASLVLKDYIPPYSATVVDRFDRAGSIMLGKLNCDAWAHGSSGENSDFGITKNPNNKEYTPGGSSSGSGAALAADMALITTGTDTCGSVRLPANYCGLVGLKPTYGAISRYGVIAMASSLDCVGFMSNCVNDSRIIFNSIRGSDGYDSTVSDKSLINKKDIKEIKIGIPKEFLSAGVDNEVKACIYDAIDKYTKLGVRFVEVSLPSTPYAIDVYYVIQPAEVSSNLGRYDGVRYGKKRDYFGQEAKRRIMLGTFVLSTGYYDAYYRKATQVRSLIINEINEVFENVDALIAPVAPTPPFKLGQKTQDPLSMYLTDIYAATANLTGIPALALPNGYGKYNLPLGFQLMAPKFSEDLLFYLGNQFESVG